MRCGAVRCGAVRCGAGRGGPARKVGAAAAFFSLSASLLSRSLSCRTSCASRSSPAAAPSATGTTWLTLAGAGVVAPASSEPGVSGGGRWGEGGEGGAEGGSFSGGSSPGAPCSAACSARTRSPAFCASLSKPRCLFMKRCRARSTNLRAHRGGWVVRKRSPGRGWSWRVKKKKHAAGGSARWTQGGAHQSAITLSEPAIATTPKMPKNAVIIRIL